jgi:hypothetical protein
LKVERGKKKRKEKITQRRERTQRFAEILERVGGHSRRRGNEERKRTE